MKRNKLAHGVAMALAGAAFSLGAAGSAHAHVVYNAFPGSPDGVNYSPYPTVSPGWYRTPDSNEKSTAFPLPFGYEGRGWLNWAAEIHGYGTLEVSAADAAEHYNGAVAKIDTNKGSWNDDGQGDGGQPPEGWGHNTDIGLIKSHINTAVTLNLTNLNAADPDNQWNNFGITVFKGMDTSAAGLRNHHGTWNTGWTPANEAPAKASNPFGFKGLTYLTHSAYVDSTKGLTFNLEKDQVYTIMLGGHQFGSVFEPTANYKLTITAVPIPAAVWMFGSALAGLGLFGRRRDKAGPSA